MKNKIIKFIENIDFSINKLLKKFFIWLYFPEKDYYGNSIKIIKIKGFRTFLIDENHQRKHVVMIWNKVRWVFLFKRIFNIHQNTCPYCTHIDLEGPFCYVDNFASEVSQHYSCEHFKRQTYKEKRDRKKTLKKVNKECNNHSNDTSINQN